MPVSYFPTIYNTHHATDDGVEMWQKEESTILWINWGENLKSKRLGGEPENHSSKKTELLLTVVKLGGGGGGRTWKSERLAPLQQENYFEVKLRGELKNSSSWWWPQTHHYTIVHTQRLPWQPTSSCAALRMPWSTAWWKT